MRRRDGLRFAGRTPTVMGHGGEDFARGSGAARARSWAARLLVAILLLCAANAARREAIGNVVPWPAARPLRIFDSSVSGAAKAAASTWARARLVGEGRGWGETFAALPTLLGEWAHRLAPPEVGAWGAAWAIGVLWALVWLWWLAALLMRWRQPSRGLALLVLAQGFGTSYWLGSMRAPIRRIETASTCRAFDLGARTTASGGMLTPSQSAEWHRARCFSGWVFADVNTKALGVSEPREFSGTDLEARDGTQRRLLLPGASVLLSLYSSESTIWQQARGQGAFVILTAPWCATGQRTRELLTVKNIPVQAIEAWSGSVGDEALALQARAKGLPVVGSAGSGAGSDCFVWTLLPADARTPSQVLAALRARRVAVAHALLESETPQNLEARRQESRRPGVVAKSWREAMSKLSRAQRLNALLQVLALALALFLWGARAAEVSEAPAGPQSVMAFVKRKRLLRRANGLAAMALAFAGSAWVASSAASLLGSWAGAPAVLAAWLALDALYLYGRAVWKRVH